MPIKDMEVSNVFTVDPEIGEETEIKGVETLTVTTDEAIDYNPNTSFAEPIEFNATMEVKDMRRLKDLLYKSITVTGTLGEISRQVFLGLPLHYEIVDLEFKQNRTHRKKRINKKYANKYGYTCKVYYYVEGV